MGSSRSHVPQTDGSEIGDHTLSTSCGVAKRPDHHCGDDLVFFNLGFHIQNWLYMQCTNIVEFIGSKLKFGVDFPLMHLLFVMLSIEVVINY